MAYRDRLHTDAKGVSTNVYEGRPKTLRPFSLQRCHVREAPNMSEWTKAPDGTYVGGSEWIMAPDGTYVGGSTWTMAPDGTYVGGTEWTQAPDGTYVGGSDWVMAPDGTYVGVD